MKSSGFFKYVKSAIMDPERDFSERVFLILTIISELTVPMGLIGDIILGENIAEIIVLTAVIIMVPIITFTCLYLDKMKFAIRVIVTSLVFAILPALFFFGGGIKGGGFVWFVFGFLYVGLALTGAWRKVMLVSLVIVSSLCFLCQYHFPDLIWDHSDDMVIADIFVSILLVGIVGCVMTLSQNMLFRDENKRAKKEAERAEELTTAQNRFFSSMSHEIRTPINSILGLNELILRNESASDEIVKDATGIQGSGKMLLSLINDILDFSKMEAGSMDIVSVDYRVGDMISEIVNMIWIKAHDKGLKFEVSIDPKVPSSLYGDEVRIKQIIINLLNNAVKYTSEGTIGLHIESEQADEKTAVLSISVSDTGMGIKKEVIPLLFTAFKRVDEEKNRNIEGTGLGLSIVKQLTELMGGTVTVNSVYGEGTTFNVTLKQTIMDGTQIGELNIHNKEMAKREKYESSFKAPDARILIVDDNEMNLEVERKLLLDTQMTIDVALSGKEALERTIEKRYDVIFMDHLMPVMDGIECLERIRNQTGGLNRGVPVIVLTANAGSDNRNLYSSSGFDGYLVKPVSGEALEDILMKHIAKDKLIVAGRMMRMREDINTTAGYTRKIPVIITSTSMSDIPDKIVKKLNIPIIPYTITTEEGCFKDGTQMDANELIRYMARGKNAVSAPPSISAYTEFFAHSLRKAHHLIHISITSKMSEDYSIASEAAKSFDNVTVINSGCISSSTGLLVLIAYKLAQQNIPVEDIVSELEEMKARLRCGFIIDTTEYMVRRRFVSQRVHRIAKALSLHTSLKVMQDKTGIGHIWMGSTERAYKKYIHSAFPVDIIPDSDVVFITYVDVSTDMLERIKDEISKITYFEHVVFMQASASISSNCGPGTFGILYFVKSNKSYNIGSFIDDEKNEDEPTVYVEDEKSAEAHDTSTALLTSDSGSDDTTEDTEKWYHGINYIDGETAIRNSGSEEAFKSVIKIFRDSAKEKSEELRNYYNEEDWKNYTVKVHAMKSSCKLIGAMQISEMAFELEKAGERKDTAFINDHHDAFIREYDMLGEELKKLDFEPIQKQDEPEEEKPVADEFLMNSVYEELKAAADDMDSDAIAGILKELEEYIIPEEERAKYDAVCEKARKYDYDGILQILHGRN